MFRRIYVLGENGATIHYRFEDKKSMESTPLLQITDLKNEIIVNEYEDDNLLRSYEYSDPTRSTEHSMSTIGDNTKLFGIHVDILVRGEHGETVDYKTPAHVHVSSLDNIKLCKVNITETCPRDNPSVEKCMYDIKTPNALLFKSKILEWANYIRTTSRGKIKNWDYSQFWWKENIETIGKNEDEVDSRRRKPK
jgi:hypothetical protein